jgi:hypothetical protein
MVRKAKFVTALDPGLFVSKKPTRCLSSAAHEDDTHKKSVAHVIEMKVHSLANEAIWPVNCDDGLPLDSRMLLALLACCYTCQVYRSADVATAICRDITFRDRCLGAAPSARTIRRFRRRNRAVLHIVLVAGLRVLAEQKLEARLIRRICEDSLEDEARRRIIMAMFIDSMEMKREQTSDVPTEMGYLFAKPDQQGH